MSFASKSRTASIVTLFAVVLMFLTSVIAIAETVGTEDPLAQDAAAPAEEPAPPAEEPAAEEPAAEPAPEPPAEEPAAEEAPAEEAPAEDAAPADDGGKAANATMDTQDVDLGDSGDSKAKKVSRRSQGEKNWKTLQQGNSGNNDNNGNNGNNETLKVCFSLDANDSADHNDSNSPHNGCIIYVRLEGFSASQTVTFIVERPFNGPNATTIYTGFVVTDASGNGTSGPVDLESALVGAPDNANQGYHVQISAGNKKKTVWVECEGEVDPSPSPTPGGTVTVNKVVTGDEAPQGEQFAFDPSWDDNPIGLGGGGSTGPISLPAGDYTIAEWLTQTQTAAGWSLTSADCVGNGNENENPSRSEVQNGDDIDLQPNEDVVCTFTNNYDPPDPQTATLYVDQRTTPDNPGTEFDFTVDDGITSESVVARAAMAIVHSFNDLTHAGGFSSKTLPPGTYTVTQLGPPAPWLPPTASCNLGSESGAANGTHSGQSVSNVVLQAGDEVYCVFTNTRPGDTPPPPPPPPPPPVFDDSVPPPPPPPPPPPSVEPTPLITEQPGDASPTPDVTPTEEPTPTSTQQPGDSSPEPEPSDSVLGEQIQQPGDAAPAPQVLGAPGDALPLTGSNPTPMAALGVMFVISGGLAIALARRKRTARD